MADLTDVFTFMVSIPQRLFELLRSQVVFTAFGFEVDLASIIIVFLILGMIVSIFWKGAKS